MERATRPAGAEGRRAVRRLNAGGGSARGLIAFAVLAACAQPGMPPGGPPDTSPPRIVSVRPDSNARNVRADAITVIFDEVVSERPRGASTLADLFLISPSDGPPQVSWRRSRIAVSPPGGLRANTTYSVRMLPGLTDLENNTDSTGFEFVFSTGPTIDSAVVAGRVFDWVQARPAREAVVEAIALPDSARYTTTADSLGAFAIRHMAPGRYLVRALVDQNDNRQLDPRELFDSMTVEVRDSLQREMLAAIRDSLGPGIQAVEARDSVRLRVTLDRPLDTAFVLSPALFTLKTADSTVLALDSLFTQAELDKFIADSTRRRALEDSVRRALREDSLRQADTTRAAQAPPRPTGRRPGAQVAVPPAPARRDTTPLPRPAARIPATIVYLEAAQPLPPGASLRLSADSLRSITGATRASTRVFQTPRATADTAARPDTGAMRRDSATQRRDTVRHRE